MERFYLKKSNEAEGNVKYSIEVSNRLQRWEIWMWRWKLIVPGKKLEKI
jgi:hypothetical protein